jgi:hypothetical protein
LLLLSSIKENFGSDSGICKFASPHLLTLERKCYQSSKWLHCSYANLTSYYIWDIEETSKPFILVRESQVQALLGEINKHLKLTLRVTDQQREEVRLHLSAYCLKT